MMPCARLAQGANLSCDASRYCDALSWHYRPDSGMSERCVPCPGREGSGTGQFGGLGSGLAGLRRRRIRNPGSLLSFS
jgi:hypothetical protein